jgi:endonuclease YncB( thermonuclease family)
MARKATQKRHKPKIKKKTCRVHTILDGDTLTVKWGNHSWLGLKRDVRLVKVRLAYIDTPELRYKQYGAQKAKEFLEKRLLGKRVVLEYEQLPTGGPRKGGYNRMLAVVHLKRGFLPNVNMNRVLLQKGLARLYDDPDNITPHHWKRLTQAERDAQRRHRGIWNVLKVSPQRTSFGLIWYIAAGIVIGILVGMTLVD